MKIVDMTDDEAVGAVMKVRDMAVQFREAVRQNEQIREALELAADVDVDGASDAVCRHLLVAIQHKARAALKATEEG